MEKTQEQKEIKAEFLVDDFVKEWRVKNNTEDAVYSAYHYDAMVAFAEYYNELNKSE
jgi:ABC-type branched-subunit amino acid transport system substrate-binding protein